MREIQGRQETFPTFQLMSGKNMCFVKEVSVAMREGLVTSNVSSEPCKP